MKHGAAALGVVLLIALASGCSGGSKPAPHEPTLLDRAIAAAGGEAAIGSIQSVEARARGEQNGNPFQAVMQRLMPDRYRHDVEVADANLVQATDGREIWATIDDFPIVVTEGDRDALLLSGRLAQISMLLPLKTNTALKVKDEGREDGFDAMRVTFPAHESSMPRGPFKLFFDPQTTLLRRIDFDAVLFGHSGTRENRIELSDYRRVGGVMVPFAETTSVGGVPVMQERVDEIRINPALSPERFAKPKPPADLLIRERTSPEVTVALLEQPGPKPDAAEDAEKELDRYLAKHKLERNGPPFRLQPLSAGEYPAVGVPIAPPPPETRPTSQPTTRELPRITTLAARRIVTTVIVRNDLTARSTAIERLLAHARANGLEPDGPCKFVNWSPDIVQIQIPVRAKKG